MAPLAVTLVPVLGVLYADERIRGAYVDRVLTNAVGISDGGGFAAGALLLVGTALVIAGLAERRYRACSAAGVGAHFCSARSRRDPARDRTRRLP